MTANGFEIQFLTLDGAAVLAGTSCSFDVSLTLPTIYAEGQYVFPDKVEVSQNLVYMFTYSVVGGNDGATYSGKGTSDAVLVVAKTEALVVNAGADQVFDCVEADDGTIQVSLGTDNGNPGIAGDSMTWTGSFMEGMAVGSNPLVTFTVGVHIVTKLVALEAIRPRLQSMAKALRHLRMLEQTRPSSRQTFSAHRTSSFPDTSSS